MRDVKLKLKCDTPEEYILKKSKQRRLELMNYLVLIFISVPVSILGFFDTTSDKASWVIQLENVITGLFIGFRLTYFFFVLSMTIIFIRVIRYFKRRKEAQLAQTRQLELMFK